MTNPRNSMIQLMRLVRDLEICFNAILNKYPNPARVVELLAEGRALQRDDYRLDSYGNSKT